MSLFPSKTVLCSHYPQFFHICSVLTYLHTKFPHPQHLVVPIFPKDQSFTRGERWAGANGVGVIPFCAPENGVLHKIVQAFLRGHVFFYIPISVPQPEKTILKEIINKKSNIIY